MCCDGLNGPQFVASVLDNRYCWRHLMMSKRLMAEVMKEDEISMTGKLEGISAMINKLAEVMGS